MAVSKEEYEAYGFGLFPEDIEDKLLAAEAEYEMGLACNCAHGAECPIHPDEPTPASIGGIAMQVAIDFKTAKALISDVLESYNESGSSLAAVDFAYELADHFGFDAEKESLSLAQERLN